MSIVDRLRDLDGAARVSEVARGGAQRREVTRLVEAGLVVRVARGIVALPGAEPQGIALACGGALTCVSVLSAAGLPLLAPPTRIHVVVPSGRGARRGVVQHWSQSAPETGAAPIEQALDHARRCLPADEWVAVTDAAVARGFSLARLVRPRAGILAFDALVRSVDGRSQSLPESLLRIALRRAGLDVRPQVQVPGVGRVDLLVDRTIVEVDGFAYHSGREPYREDRRRDRAALAAGYAVLRFTFEEVMRERDRVVAEVVRAVTPGQPTRSV